MALTKQTVREDLARFQNREGQLVLGWLKLLQRIGALARTGGTDAPSYVRDVEAAKAKLAGQQEALDREVAAHWARRREEAKRALLGAALPSGTAERTLFELVKQNARAQLLPYFDSPQPNAFAVIRHFEGIRATADELTIRATYDVIQALAVQYPAAFSFPGVNLTEVTWEGAERISEATRLAQEALSWIAEAEGEWDAFRNRRGRQVEAACGLNKRSTQVDLVTAFTDFSLSPYQRLMASQAGTAVDEALLVALSL